MALGMRRPQAGNVTRPRVIQFARRLRRLTATGLVPIVLSTVAVAQIALANFKEAGVSGYIDARLGDAHAIVPALPGPFDFVFSDADKDWYKNYFVALWPKIVPGGCFTAHNVSGSMRGIPEFLAHLKTLPDATTTIDTTSRAGMSITCKKQP